MVKKVVFQKKKIYLKICKQWKPKIYESLITMAKIKLTFSINCLYLLQQMYISLLHSTRISLLSFCTALVHDSCSPLPNKEKLDPESKKKKSNNTHNCFFFFFEKRANTHNCYGSYISLCKKKPVHYIYISSNEYFNIFFPRDWWQ